jgi:hypothetical protein
VCLDQQGAVPGSLSHALYFIEQHRLANSTQPGEQHALFWPPGRRPAQQHARLLQNAIAARKLKAVFKQAACRGPAFRPF